MRGKRILQIVMTWCILALLTAGAHRTVQADPAGSVRLMLPQKAAGVEMTLYSIAELKDGSFIYNEAFAGSGVVITDTANAAETQKAAEALASYAAAQNISGVKQTAAQDGTIAFTGLTSALYLAAQTGGTDIMEIQPIVVPLPYTPAGAQTESYDAVLSPKYSFPGGAVIINKTDEGGKPLGNAEFKLQQRIDENGSFSWKELKTSLVTDENGQITVTDLPLGSYQFIETKAPDGFELLTSPVAFEITQAGKVKKLSGIYVQDTGKVEILQVVNKAETPEITGSIIVTKNLKDEHGNFLGVKENTFYVALFEDKERTKRISDVKAITFRNTSSSTVTFDNLKTGVPYYLGETNEEGILTEDVKKHADIVYAASYPEGREITPTLETPEGKIRFENVFYQLPDGYYYDSPTPTPETKLTATPTPANEPSTPDTPNTPDTPADTHGSGSSPVKTGDDTPIALYIMILALAGIAAAGILIYRKKRRNH